MPRATKNTGPEPQAENQTTLEVPGPEAQTTTDTTAEAPKPKPRAQAKTKTAPQRSMFLSLDDTKTYLNVLLYGKEGVGKTTSAAEAANTGRTLVINAEGGLKTGALRRQGINTSNIAVWPTPGTQITYETLDELYRTISADLDQDPDAWYCVVMDSVTDVLATLTSNVSDNRIAKVRNRGVAIDQYDAFETDRNDYGVMGKQFKDLVRKFRDLQVHFVMTALERRDIDPDTGSTTYGPAANPGIQKDLLGYADMVLYLRAADPEDGKPNRALTRPTKRYRAKDRLGALPRTLNEPTFGRILAYSQDEITEDTDPLQTAPEQEQAPTENTNNTQEGN